MINGIRFWRDTSSARSIFFITTPVIAPPSTVGSLNISEHSTSFTTPMPISIPPPTG